MKHLWMLFLYNTYFWPQRSLFSLLDESGLRGFTRDPSQLQGDILCTTLKKSPLGFGFTIIGGDRTDEFLQVKNVLRDGPAAHDNKIASGNSSRLLFI